ncbi:mannosyl-glycoprotein endo-beta-N-acetylglucosamidase [Burkholderia lata]|uniref:Mannosyl-glycoprotein endo-beta-N-acetylglucosamidase n=2 Tax=Burkholderia lata (strain ATCC 17760 / DSM 23089 / LMG 22485 / NCIMB 9086 / R18194 / 383) TaxID=482957 RepID=A0A6P2GRD6_BURL3|nr:mannosyl-glycoprotein endo-beta-N-acetylglucosamidase [Burkholderia lata]
MSKSFGAMAESHKKFSSSLRESNDQMGRMAALSQKFGGGMFGIVGHVAGGNSVAAVETAVSTLGNLLPGIGKIAAIVAGIGTAAIAAGKKLGDDAVSQQRAARRVGVSSGQLQSFDLNFGRYADPGMLNRAADAQADMRKLPYAMLATGQSMSQIQSEGSDQVAISMIQRAHDWWNRTPPAMRNQQTLAATGLDKFMSFEDVRGVGAMSNEELAQAKSNYALNAQQFSVSDQSVNKWYGMSRGLDAAAIRAKTGLQDDLPKAAGTIADLLTGKAPAGASTALDGLRKSADELSKGFDVLNKQLTGPHPLGTISQDPKWTVKGEAERLVNGAKTLGKYVAGMVSTSASAAEISPELAKKAGPDAVKWALQDQSKYGIPAAVTLAQFGLESSFGKYMPGDSKNPFGIHAAAGQDYVLGYDTDANGRRVPTKFRKFKSLEEAFDQHAKLLATGKAYAEARKHADDPRAFADALTGRYAEDPLYGKKLKREMGYVDIHPDTKRHLDRTAAAVAKRSTVNLKVDVHNSTAARVAISTNAAAIGS